MNAAVAPQGGSAGRSGQDVEAPSRAVRVLAKAADIDALRLQLVDQKMPAHGPGEAVVRVLAAAINPSDVKASLGLMPQAVWPRTPGQYRQRHRIIG